MTFTGRIRSYLLLIALLPPLLVMTVIYWQGEHQSRVADRRAALRNIERFEQYNQSELDDLHRAIRDFLASDEFRRARILIRSGNAADIRLDPRAAGLDFVELLDSRFKVLASGHRPGLVGDLIPSVDASQPADSALRLTVEIDRNGRHAAYTYLTPIGDGLNLYAGRYVGQRFTSVASQLIGADVGLVFRADADGALVSMEPDRLYTQNDSLRALLVGGDNAGFLVAATFPPGTDAGTFRSLIWATGFVAVVSALLALALGFYISGKAKREIENLVSATSRVASGDFTTPVMAYEEGEFAQLADSFTEMTFRLKDVQSQLATSEKIAAWQAMGRKIAHEIKNPLTPIAISTDDLRRSYREQLPDFPRILDETTSTIRMEVNRLTALLDEFVRFARMSPPKIRRVPLAEFIENLSTLYRSHMADGRLNVVNQSAREQMSVDPDALRQVLINLIKNGLESGADSSVTVTLSDEPGDVRIAVEDDGPGFPPEVIERGFEPYVSTKKDGSGLGLVISQRIVYDHGGRIELANRAEGGAVITLRLPVDHG